MNEAGGCNLVSRPVPAFGVMRWNKNAREKTAPNCCSQEKAWGKTVCQNWKGIAQFLSAFCIKFRAQNRWNCSVKSRLCSFFLYLRLVHGGETPLRLLSAVAAIQLFPGWPHGVNEVSCFFFFFLCCLLNHSVKLQTLAGMGLFYKARSVDYNATSPFQGGVKVRLKVPYTFSFLQTTMWKQR